MYKQTCWPIGQWRWKLENGFDGQRWRCGFVWGRNVGLKTIPHDQQIENEKEAEIDMVRAYIRRAHEDKKEMVYKHIPGITRMITIHTIRSHKQTGPSKGQNNCLNWMDLSCRLSLWSQGVLVPISFSQLLLLLPCRFFPLLEDQETQYNAMLEETQAMQLVKEKRK